MVHLRPIRRSLSGTFKAVRLRALAESPYAFGSTYAKESTFSDADWQRRIEQWSGPRARGLLAFDASDQGDACGLAVGLLDSADSSRAHVVSVWVAPTHRGRGVGRLLMGAVMDWARTHGVHTVRLDVTSNNTAALAFYERLGFVRTGRTEPYPNDPAVVEYEMSRTIA